MESKTEVLVDFDRQLVETIQAAEKAKPAPKKEEEKAAAKPRKWTRRAWDYSLEFRSLSRDR